MRYTKTIIALAAATALMSSIHAAQADEADRIAEQIAPFIDEGTYAVAYVNLTDADLPAVVDRFGVKLGFPEEEVAKAKIALTGLQSMVKLAFGQSGKATDPPIVAYYVMSTTYMTQTPGLVVVPIPEGADLGLIEPLRRSGPLGGSNFVHKGCLVFMYHDCSDMVRDLEPTPRPEIATLFRAAGDGNARLIITPPDYVRKVIRDLMPNMPEPLGGGSSRPLTDGLRGGAASATISNEPSFHAVIQATDEENAVALRAMIDGGVDLFLTAQREDLERLKLHALVESLLGAVTPTQEGDRLVLSYDARRLDELADSLAPVIRTAMFEDHRHQSASRLKQIGMRLHEYESRNKGLPPLYSADADGRPLLSWRVHLLRVVDPKLFEQFHLDEPWDSEHNKTLIAEMPWFYTSPFARPETTKAGKTRYVALTGKGLLLQPGEGRSFASIKRDASRSPMVVEVDEEHAVIWTKPDDLVVDRNEPEAFLEATRDAMLGGEALVLMADGGVHRNSPERFVREEFVWGE